uniref:Uncharacterized protein n=1 Tax=Setaria digitata TaxID=48799 RepID=A0A915Q1E9_9BILA
MISDGLCKKQKEDKMKKVPLTVNYAANSVLANSRQEMLSLEMRKGARKRFECKKSGAELTRLFFKIGLARLGTRVLRSRPVNGTQNAAMLMALMTRAVSWPAAAPKSSVVGWVRVDPEDEAEASCSSGGAMSIESIGHSGSVSLLLTVTLNSSSYCSSHRLGFITMYSSEKLDLCPMCEPEASAATTNTTATVTMKQDLITAHSLSSPFHFHEMQTIEITAVLKTLRCQLYCSCLESEKAGKVEVYLIIKLNG